MKPRNTIYDKLVRQKMVRKFGLGDEPRLTNIGGMFCANWEPSKTPFTHVKLYRRGESCVVIPDDTAEFLMVIAQELDADGEWFPSRVLTAHDYSQLKASLREIIAATDGVVVQAAGWFGPLALELGLGHLTSEWGKLRNFHRSLCVRRYVWIGRDCFTHFGIVPLEVGLA